MPGDAYVHSAFPADWLRDSLRSPGGVIEGGVHQSIMVLSVADRLPGGQQVLPHLLRCPTP